MTFENDSDQPWPIAGQSYNVAATTVVLAVTTLAALAARLYVLLQHKGELPVLASAVSICSSHAFMICQSACVIAACYYGWGLTFTSIPDSNLRTAETLFFVSNVLLIAVHGCSRTSIAITLWRACNATPSAKFAIAIFCAIVLWTVGSLLGLIARRATEATFWIPVGADCSFVLWAIISLSGLAIDLAIAVCATSFMASLQIGVSKKFYTLFVFGAGILVIIPNAYGLACLYRFNIQLAQDPTFFSASFIKSNQAAIAVSLWCRALETARKIQQDMGYASYGLPSFSASDYFRSSSRARPYYGSGSRKTRTVQASHAPASGLRRSLSEDEVRLRPDADHVAEAVIVPVDTNGTSSKRGSNMGGIGVRREFGWSVTNAHNSR